MNCELLVLAVLPPGLPGLKQAAIRERIAYRVNKTPGAVLPTRNDIAVAIANLARKRLVHSALRPPQDGDGSSHRVYWRDPSYTPPTDVKVPA